MSTLGVQTASRKGRHSGAVSDVLLFSLPGGAAVQTPPVRQPLSLPRLCVARNGLCCLPVRSSHTGRRRFPEKELCFRDCESSPLPTLGRKCQLCSRVDNDGGYGGKEKSRDQALGHPDVGWLRRRAGSAKEMEEEKRAGTLQNRSADSKSPSETVVQG